MSSNSKRVKSNIISSVECDLQGLTGLEMVDRLVEWKKSLIGVYNPITQTHTTEIPEFCVNVSILDKNQKYFIFSFDGKSKYTLVMSNMNSKTTRVVQRWVQSTTIVGVRPAGNYVSQTIPDTYKRKSSKFEGRIFESIINFIDHDLM